VITAGRAARVTLPQTRTITGAARHNRSSPVRQPRGVLGADGTWDKPAAPRVEVRTKLGRDPTPEKFQGFVADPLKGSRHTRGCAVDLALYDLKGGQPVGMPSGYVEFPDRAFPDYPGETSRRRWHRDLLRRGWGRRASPSTKKSGGTSTTRTGSSTRS